MSISLRYGRDHKALKHFNPHKSIAKQLSDLEKRADRKLMNSYSRMWENMSEHSSIAEAARLLRAGDNSGAMNVLRTTSDAPRMKSLLSPTYLGVTEASGLDEANRAPVVQKTDDDIFDPTESWTYDTLMLRLGTLVFNLDQQQRQLAASVLLDGMSRNLSFEVIADQLESTIGLTPQQARWVSNYRENLVRASRGQGAAAGAGHASRTLTDRRYNSMVERALQGDEVAQQKLNDRIDDLTNSYSRRMRQYRNRTIARTESMFIMNHGAYSFWHQKIARGEILEEQVRKRYLSREDSKVRPIHARYDTMSEQSDPLGFPFNYLFRNKDGVEYLYPPISVNCRCKIVYYIIQL